MKISDKTANGYYKSVKRALSLPAKDSADFLSKLQRNLMAYLDTNPHPTQENLIETFGEPKASAKYYIEEMGLGKATEKRRKVRRIATIAVVCVLVVVLSLSGAKIYQLLSNTEVEVTETIIVHSDSANQE